MQYNLYLQFSFLSGVKEQLNSYTYVVEYIELDKLFRAIHIYLSYKDGYCLYVVYRWLNCNIYCGR